MPRLVRNAVSDALEVVVIFVVAVLQSNVAMFEMRNGGCGYVLKPDYLRSPHPVLKTVFDCSKPELDPRCVSCLLTIKVAHTPHAPRPTPRMRRTRAHTVARGFDVCAINECCEGAGF